MDVMKNTDRTFTLDELAALVDINTRTIRFYIQKGLVDRPEGLAKGSFYTHRHLEQLLAIRKWKDAGLSLERIQELIGEESADLSAQPIPPPRRKRPGAIEVWSHIHIADGVEVHIEPQRSGLSPEQVRRLSRAILDHYQTIIKEGE
jgi:DNA-binding transcriptional MerR regulator